MSNPRFEIPWLRYPCVAHSAHNAQFSIHFMGCSPSFCLYLEKPIPFKLLYGDTLLVLLVNNLVIGRVGCFFFLCRPATSLASWSDLPHFWTIHPYQKKKIITIFYLLSEKCENRRISLAESYDELGVEYILLSFHCYFDNNTGTICLPQGKWFLRAAEAGNVRAMYNTSLCYSTGEGLQQSHRRARMWMKLAADQGHRKAQLERGLELYSVLEELCLAFCIPIFFSPPIMLASLCFSWCLLTFHLLVARNQ